MQQKPHEHQNIRHRNRRSPLRHSGGGDAAPDESQLGKSAPATDAGNDPRGRLEGGAWWNIRTSAGAVLAKWFPARPTHDNGLLKNGQKLLTQEPGGYPSRDIAVTRERSDKWYPHLCRQAMHQGYNDRWGKHLKPTLNDISKWTGLSLHSLRAWLKPTTSKSHRPMPRYAIRLILHEFNARDNSKYNWKAKLRHCR